MARDFDILTVDLKKANPAIVLRMLMEDIVPEAYRADDWEQRWQDMIDYCEQPVTASPSTP